MKYLKIYIYIFASTSLLPILSYDLIAIIKTCLNLAIKLTIHSSLRQETEKCLKFISYLFQKFFLVLLASLQLYSTSLESVHQGYKGELKLFPVHQDFGVSHSPKFPKCQAANQ
jgi:hypothetical protein